HSRIVRSPALQAHAIRRLSMAQKVATEQLTISEWVKGLAAIPVREFTLKNVQDYVVRHGVLPETLDKYSYFSKGSYTRNLIFRNDLFECMTVCWEVGQHSRIHNHSKPFDTCEVYLRDHGTYSDVPLFYTSEYGKLNSAEKLL